MEYVGWIACAILSIASLFLGWRYTILRGLHQALALELTRVRTEFEQFALSAEKMQQVWHAEHTTHTTQLNAQLHTTQHELAILRDQWVTAQRELVAAQTDLKNVQQASDERIQLLKTAREEMQTQFKVLADEVLQEKTKQTTEQQQHTLNHVLAPLQLQIGEFKQKIETYHQQGLIQHTEFKTQLVQLQTLNQQMTNEAHALATALKGQSKLRGNWGELVLENILESAGLTAPNDYEREVSFERDGKKFRPDVIVHLPQKKHLIIDSKVVLNNYLDYVNADDESLKQQALKLHIEAVRARIKSLSNKEYFDLNLLNSPDIVVMFIPVESALSECLRVDDQLLTYALESKVLLTTPSTLLASLNIIKQLWRLEKQNEHSMQLAERATKIYKKLLGFLNSMDDVGKQLDRSRDAYQKAVNQLCQGKDNLIKQAQAFETLGVVVQGELGLEWRERADLGAALDHNPQLN